MSEPPDEIRTRLDTVFRAESGRILATLIRLLGGFDLAEDAMHDAFNAASPVVELNRAAAVAMNEGPAAGLALIDALLARGELRDYHLAHSARADLFRRLGRRDEARAAYEQARSLAKSDPEMRYLEKRLRELSAEDFFANVSKIAPTDRPDMS